MAKYFNNRGVKAKHLIAPFMPYLNVSCYCYDNAYNMPSLVFITGVYMLKLLVETPARKLDWHEMFRV